MDSVQFKLSVIITLLKIVQSNLRMKLGECLKLQGTVLFTIWRRILLFVVYTAGLLCVHNFTQFRVDFPLTLIPILGVVTGLLLVFRTNTAYDRFYEGRNIWSRITLNIRILTRTIWISIKEEDQGGNEPRRTKLTKEEGLIEKASAINLLIAFAYATKNHLREEYSHEEKKLSSLISHLPELSPPSHLDSIEFLQRTQQCRRIVPTNIPIEITYYIAGYMKSVKERGLADDMSISAMNTAVNNLVECLGGLERILRTPIPIAYSVHLKHATWIFLLTLPYQMIGFLNWFTIPALALAAFALLGILEIGREIENPFGDDDNDLPLDDFCDTMYMESWRFTGYQMPSPQAWLLSPDNRPLTPGSSLPASVLGKMDESNIRKIFARRAEMRIANSRQGCVERDVEFQFLSVPPAIVVCNGEEKDELKPIFYTEV